MDTYELRVRWATSPVRRVTRHRWVRFAAVGLIVGVCAVAWQGAQADLVSARRGWTATAEIHVVASDLRAGAPLAGATVPMTVPLVAIPPGAVRLLDKSMVARTDLYRGDVVTARRIVDERWRRDDEAAAAVALTMQTDAGLVESGALVDIWRIDPRTGEVARVVAAVTVLDRDGDGLTVTARADEVAALAEASVRPVIVTLVG